MLHKRSVFIAGALFISTLCLTGCFENPTDSDEGKSGLQSEKLFVVETDYQSGLLEWMSAEGTALADDNIPVYKDAVVRTYDGYLYILERRGADNIVKFDPSESDESGVLYQVQLGDNWNPYDIEFVNDVKAYIANQNEPKITIFNPATGKVDSHIDIATYTFNPDSNASPYANRMALSNGKLYVMLQRRDGWNPGAPTMILTIDTETDEIAATDTMVCRYANGYDMVCVDDALYVTNPGSLFSTGDGAVEKITLENGEVQTVIDEETLGGNPNQIVHKEGSRFYVQNYIGWQNVTVVEIDAADGTIVATLPDIKDAYGGITYDKYESKLYVGERDSTEMGIHVFENNVKIEGPIKSDNSLPPSGMVMIR